MATSGTYTFNLEIAEVIEQAYELAGVPVADINGRALRSGRTATDLLLKDWQNRQINLWQVELDSFTVTQGTSEYTLNTALVGDDATQDLLDCYLTRDSVDQELIRISRDEYALRPNKTDQGRPTQFFIERFTSSVKMTLWQTPENSTDVVKMYRIRSIQDTGNFQNNPDVPTRFLPALVKGVACELYKRRPKKDVRWYQMMTADYFETLQAAMSEDRERTSTHFVPKIRGIGMGW